MPLPKSRKPRARSIGNKPKQSDGRIRALSKRAGDTAKNPINTNRRARLTAAAGMDQYNNEQKDKNRRRNPAPPRQTRPEPANSDFPAPTPEPA